MYRLDELNDIIEKGFLSLKLHEPPKELYEPIEYMLSMGGKRLRPMTCLMTYNLFHEKIERNVLYPAMALEVFHAFTLIHDDIMDNASIRRGKETVHKKWGANSAILSGDVMSIKAYELLSHVKPVYIHQVMKLFTKTAIEVCEGQQYDMNFENERSISMNEYIKMIGLKTGVLIACSTKMGAILAGVEESVCNMLYDYAYNLGIAFQIMDDYLDSFGNPEVFGKSIGGDILNNKKTWLLVEAMKEAAGAYKKELEKIIAMPSSVLNSADIEADNFKISKMKAMYQHLGVDRKALDAVDEYGKKALDMMEASTLSEEQKLQLRAYAAKMLHRDK